jgi:hypothetical protein
VLCSGGSADAGGPARQRVQYIRGLLTQGVLGVPQDPLAPLGTPLNPLQLEKAPWETPLDLRLVCEAHRCSLSVITPDTTPCSST